MTVIPYILGISAGLWIIHIFHKRSEHQKEVDRCVRELTRCKHEVMTRSGSLDDKSTPRWGAALGLEDWFHELVELQQGKEGRQPCGKSSSNSALPTCKETATDARLIRKDPK